MDKLRRVLLKSIAFGVVAITLVQAPRAARSQNAAASDSIIDCSGSSVLNDVARDEKLRMRLLRQLAASSDWRVGIERGAIVAVKGLMRSTPPQTGENETVVANTGITMRIRFGAFTQSRARPPALVAGEIPVPVLAGEEQGTAHRSSYPEIDGLEESHFVIRGGENEFALYMELDELSADPKRSLTNQAVQDLAKMLAEFTKHSEEVEKEGFVKSIAPQDSSRDIEGPATLEVADGFQKGIYDLSGYINSGEMGYITIEAIHVKTGKQIAAENMAFRTIQYVGWSPDPRRKFLFKQKVTLNEFVPDTDGDDLEVSFRVVFHPLERRILVEKTRRASIWQR